MNSLLRALKIRPGEGRLVAVLIGRMFFLSAGGSIGGNAIDALFFARFGAQYLPYMYIALGIVTLATLLSTAALLSRVTRERLYLGIPFVLALVLIVERALLSFEFNWFYPVLWLGMNVFGALQNLSAWGLAGAITDTRQAKRLFPLFGAGTILGAVLGGFITSPLSSALHSENLLLVWAGALIAGFALGQVLLVQIPASQRPRRVSDQQRAGGQQRAGSKQRAGGKRPAGPIDQIREGYRFVRQSRLMRWILVSGTAAPIVMYSLVLPFAQAAAVQYSNADALAGFLGVFQGGTTLAALATSLFVANRIYARFGIMSTRIVLTAIYVIGFGVLTIFPVFPAIVVFRFATMMWEQGVSNTAYQAIFNVVPSSRREQVRSFIGAVPDQLGTLSAGVFLAIGQQTLQPQHLYLIGLGVAVLVTFVLIQQQRAYTSALIDALNEGQPQVFFDEREPFGGLQHDAAAISTVVAGLSHSDSAVRRVSVEILCNLPAPQASDALTDTLSDPDVEVRAAALRALVCAKAAPALLDIAACLNDPEPDVRAQAIEALGQLAGHGRSVMNLIRPLLGDVSPTVRARAALALLHGDSSTEARNVLFEMAQTGDAESRIEAVKALGAWGGPEAREWISAALRDRLPNVRRAAAIAFTSRHDDVSLSSVDVLIRAMGDEDATVREAVSRAMGRIGLPALKPVVAALSDPALEVGALTALEHLPAAQAASDLRHYIWTKSVHALRYHSLQRGLHLNGDDRLRLLADSLQDAARRHALNALRAAGLLTDRHSMAVAIDNLTSRDPQQRANALESLESLGERDLIRPLLSLWETGESGVSSPGEPLLSLLQDSDAWLRACAVLAARDSKNANVRLLLAQLAQSDADAFIRESAASALQGGASMQTLPTLSLMDRVLFLRRVPLFADLAPMDLKHIAALADERFFADRDLIAQEGDPGDEMFIIVSGEVRVAKANVDVTHRKPGEVVGEMAIISQEPRMASLIATGNVRVLCLDRKQFEGMLRERPEISLAVMRVLIARLKESEARARSNR